MSFGEVDSHSKMTDSWLKVKRDIMKLKLNNRMIHSRLCTLIRQTLALIHVVKHENLFTKVQNVKGVDYIIKHIIQINNMYDTVRNAVNFAELQH